MSCIIQGMTLSIAEVAMDQDFKVRENRLRRAAERQELRLTKSRRRDPHATSYGKYALIDTKGRPVAGTRMMSIDDVERYLNGAEER